jgi:hypothetical protein
MRPKNRYALLAGIAAVLIGGAAVARTASDCCCKDRCCDETAAQSPAPTAT